VLCITPISLKTQSIQLCLIQNQRFNRDATSITLLLMAAILRALQLANPPTL
jgi:hypothetical protein